MKVIDSHVHIWNTENLSLPWLKSEKYLNQTFLEKDYLDSVKESKNIELLGAIYVEVDSAPNDKMKENKMSIDLCNSDSIFKGTSIYIDLTKKDAEEKMYYYSGLKCVKGVRHVLHVPESIKGTCLQLQFIKNVNLLSKYNLVFEACIRNNELRDIHTLALSCPNTVIVLNHMGLPDAQIISKKNPKTIDLAYKKNWCDSILSLASLPNVCCKISGIMPKKPFSAKDLEETIMFCINAFKEDRILFASNFPVCNLAISFSEWIDILETCLINENSTLKSKFFFSNAARIYGLNIS